MIFEDPRPPRRRRFYWAAVCFTVAFMALWLTATTVPLWGPEARP